MSEATKSENLNIFTDLLLTTVVQRLAPDSSKSKRKRVKGRKNEIKAVQPTHDTGDSAADLSEFVQFLAQEIFDSLPDDLQVLSYAAIQSDEKLHERYALPLTVTQLEDISECMSTSVVDSLLSYGMLKDEAEIDRFLEPTLSNYISTTTSTPSEHAPAETSARPDGCEICERTQLPLTYHHLIPRSMHDKAVKRNWHAEWELSKVAWLCRACHSYVHKIASNEELARTLYSIDLLLEREDVQKWASWASRIRWKAR